MRDGRRPHVRRHGSSRIDGCQAAGPASVSEPPVGRPRRLLRAARHASALGFSFVELLVVTALVAVLASAVMPLTRVTMQRQKEIELRRALRELRTAIDHFKDAADQGMIAGTELDVRNEGYPPDLDVLIEGVAAAGTATGRKLKFLRRVPIDPMTGTTDWGKRSYQDRPDSRSWGGQNVFDVYTTSDGTALDGSRYRDW
jgi:general secretion pathway protein G